MLAVIHNAAHNVRYQHLAVIGNRTNGCDHLDGRDSDALSEGVSRQVHHNPLVVIGEAQGEIGFTRQVHPGAAAEAESLNVFVEILFAQQVHSDMGQADVQGVLHTAGHVLFTPSAAIPVVDWPGVYQPSRHRRCLRRLWKVSTAPLSSAAAIVMTLKTDPGS